MGKPCTEESRGFSLVELLVTMAMLGIIASVAIPSLAALNRKRELRAAAGELRSIIWEVRARAIAKGRNSAVKFAFVDGEWQYAIFDDGDGDGVRNADIDSGQDPIAVSFRRVFGTDGHVKIGLPLKAVRDPDRGVVTPDQTPVRFNRSTLCSFSPIGSGTSGSIYLTNGKTAAVVRVYGPLARLRLLILDPMPDGGAK